MPPKLKRMSGKQLAAIRERRDESLEAFGAYLARLVENKRPYSRQDVWAWENELKGRLPPLAIQMALEDTGEFDRADAKPRRRA